MASVVNKFDFPRPISTREVLPFTMTFTNIPVQASNSIVIARRVDFLDYQNYLDGDTSTFEDISAKAAVGASDNIVTVADIWSADTPAAGTYDIKVVLKDNTGTVSDEEMNVIIKVLAS